MKWNKKFKYPASTRSLIQGSRHYDVGQEKLPSVTTILAATQPPEKRKALEDWKARVGEQEAQRIVTEAAGVGTALHNNLEKFLAGEKFSLKFQDN